MQQEVHREAQLLTIIELIRRKILREKPMEQIVEEVEWEENFVFQICELMKCLTLEETNDSILNKWRSQFAA